MSEYSWPTRKAWIGVKAYDKVAGCGDLLGVVRRSGTVKALGHFCHVKVTYQGKKRWAGGAEARIYPFHSFELEEGETAKDLELLYLGWCIGGNIPAFLDPKTANVLELVGAGSTKDNTRPIPRDQWNPKWTTRVVLAERQAIRNVLLRQKP